MIRVLIQVASGSSDRKIYNEQTLEFIETRSGSIPYRYPYGFIIGTQSADGGAVDCYIITKDNLIAGDIYECKPIGLLEQLEGEEIDHKVLAKLPGQVVEITPELQNELQEFIYALFARHPEVHVGTIQSKGTALRHIQAHQV